MYQSVEYAAVLLKKLFLLPEEEMQLPENLSDFGKLAELSKEMDSLKAEIADLYDKWECLELC